MKRLLIIAPLLMVAACGGEAAKDGAGTDTAAATSGDGGTMKAGQWEIATKVDDISMPGMPPEAAAQMKSAKTTANTSVCFTEEQVKKPDLTKVGNQNGNCTTERNVYEAGKIDVAATCKGGAGGDSTVKMVGTYGAESFAYAMETTSKSPMGGGDMTMKMDISGTRTGECTADAKAG